MVRHCCIVLIIIFSFEGASQSAAQERSPPEFRLEPVSSIAADHSITAMAWSRNGQLIATLSNFGSTVDLWAKNGRHLTRLPELRINGPYTGNALGFFNNDTVLITPAPTKQPPDASAAFALWNIGTQELISIIASPGDGGSHMSDNLAYRLAISPDERHVAMLRHNRSLAVAVYSTKSWSLERKIQPELSQSSLNVSFLQKHSIEFSGDNASIITGMVEAISYLPLDASRGQAAIRLPERSHAWAASINRSGSLVAAIVSPPPQNSRDYIGFFSNPDLGELTRINGSYASISWSFDQNILAAATNYDAGQLQLIKIDRGAASIAYAKSISGGTATVHSSPTDNVVAVKHVGKVTLYRWAR